MSKKEIIQKCDSLKSKLIGYEDGDLLGLIDVKDGLNELKSLIEGSSSEFIGEIIKAFDDDIHLNSKDDFFEVIISFIKFYKFFVHGEKKQSELEEEIGRLKGEIERLRVVSSDTVVTGRTGYGYTDNYFSSIIEDLSMLNKFYDEAKDHLTNAQFSLLDLEYDPSNSENINRVFRAFHTLKSSSAFLGFKNMEEVSHEMENMLVLIRDGHLKISKELIDVIFFGIGLLKDLSEVMEMNNYNIPKMVECYKGINIYNYIEIVKNIIKDHRVKKIGEILEEQGKISKELVDKILLKQKEGNKKFGEIALEENLISESDLNKAMKKQTVIGAKKTSYVKVSNDRLNSLIDMVGELVITQSMIREILTTVNVGDTVMKDRNIVQLETVTTNIKNIVLSMGMVPISEIFNKLRVIIRNVSHEENKVVDVEVIGETTELDRNVIESIYDPLVHIVRNSVDHGIESAEERERLGKNKIGRIVVSAEHKGSGILISITDDGKGIDKDKVIKKAIDKGLIVAEDVENLTSKDINALLFLPGFSTAEKVTEISGRGVGLDVVKKNIDQIHGKIDIYSEKGKYTKFMIKIPLTLAIIDGFVTIVNEKKYIFPFNIIEEIVVPEPKDITLSDDGQKLLFIRGKFVPIVFAGEMFSEGVYKRDDEKVIVIIIHFENKNYGIAVDYILGKQEIVIKSLNEALHNLKLFSGGTIFGDGSIGFIVDIEEFMEKAKL